MSECKSNSTVELLPPTFKESVRMIFEPIIKFPASIVMLALVIVFAYMLVNGEITSRIPIVVASILLVVAVFADIHMMKLFRRVSEGSLVLLAEAKKETGPYTSESKDDHEFFIDFFFDEIIERASNVLTYIHPNHYVCNPKKLRQEVSHYLTNATTEIEIEVAIRKAALAIDRFYRKTAMISPIEKNPLVLKHISDELLDKINDAFVSFHNEVEKLEFSKLFNDAMGTCMAGRIAATYLFLTWHEYKKFGEQKKIKMFSQDLARAQELSLTVADNKEYKTMQDTLLAYGASHKRRLRTLETLEDNNLQAYRKLLEKEVA